MSFSPGVTGLAGCQRGPPPPSCTAHARFQTWSRCVRRTPEPGEAPPAGVEVMAVPFPPRSHFLPVPSSPAAAATQASDPTFNQGPTPAQASQLSLKVDEFPDHGTSGAQLRPPAPWCRLSVPRITSVLQITSGSPLEAPGKFLSQVLPHPPPLPQAGSLGNLHFSPAPFSVGVTLTPKLQYLPAL